PALAVCDEAPHTAAAAAPAQELPPIGPKLAGANVEAGKAIFQKQCFTCHTVDKGGPNKVGPKLWGGVGRGKGGRALVAGGAGRSSRRRAPPATPSTRAAPTRSARTCGASLAAPKRVTRASATPRACRARAATGAMKTSPT